MTSYDLRQRFGIRDPYMVPREDPYAPSIEREEQRENLGLPSSNPGSRIARLTPTTMPSSYEPVASNPYTPAEIQAGRSARDPEPDEERGFLQSAALMAGNFGKELIRSVNVFEDDIRHRDRAWRALNLASFALPLGVGANVTRNLAARLFPGGAVARALGSARGRLALTSISEAAVAGSLEAIRPLDMDERRSVTSAVLVGGVAGAGAQLWLNSASRKARRKATEGLANALQSQMALADGANGPLARGTYSILTAVDDAVALRARTGHESAVDFANQRSLALKLMLEDEGFIPLRVTMRDGRDGFLVPGMMERDAIRVAQDLKVQDEIMTNEGLVDLTRGVVYPNRRGFEKIGMEMEATVDNFFALRVKDAPAERNTVYVTHNVNRADPRSIGAHEPVDLTDLSRIQDESMMSPRIWRVLTRTDGEERMKWWYRQVLDSTWGASEIDGMLSAVETGTVSGRARRAKGGMRGAEEIVQGKVITADKGLQKLIQINAAKWSGWAETAFRRGMVKWDNVGEMYGTLEKGLFQILDPVTPRESENFIRYGLYRRFEDLHNRGLAIPENVGIDEITRYLDEIHASPHGDRYRGVLDELTTFQNELMEETLVKQGIISRAQFEKFKAKNPIFIPLTRVRTKLPRTVEDMEAWLVGAPADPVRRAEGTTTEPGDLVAPWIEEMMSRGGMYARMASQQEAYNAAGRQVLQAPEAMATYATKVDELTAAQLEVKAGLRELDEFASDKLSFGSSMVSNEDGIFIRTIDKDFDPHRLMRDTSVDVGPTGKYDKNGNYIAASANADTGRIQIDKQFLRDTFDEKRWTKPRAPGVTPLPEDAFSSAEEWIEFVTLHESAHTKFRPEDLGLEPKSAAYENAINTIAIRDMHARHNGQAVNWLRVADGDNGQAFLDALQFLGPSKSEDWARFLGAPARVLRAGVTLGPDFVGKNVGRDVIFAFANAGIRPTAFLHGALAMATKKFMPDSEWGKRGLDLVTKFEASGAAQATLVSQDIRHFRKLIDEQQARSLDRVVNVWNPINKLQALSEVMENATRIGSFRQRIKQLEVAANARGVQLDPRVLYNEAAIYSREGSVDFGIHGASVIMANLNTSTAFFNATLQGTNQLVKAIANDPQGVFGRMGLAITMPSVALYFANRGDPDYKDLPEHEKDLFWHIKRGNVGLISAVKGAMGGERDTAMLGKALGEDEGEEDDLWLRFPKPFEAGMVAGTYVERFLEFVEQEDPELLDQAAADMFSRMGSGFVPMPTALAPKLETLANVQSVTGAPVIPMQLENVDPDFHPGSSISVGLARWLNRGEEDPADKVSPLELDRFIKGYTGGVGRLMSDFADISVSLHRSYTGEPAPRSPAKDVIERMPIARAFVSSYPAGSQNMRDFYDIADRVTEVGRTLGYLEDAMRTDDMIDFINENYNLIGLDSVTQKVQDDLASMRDARAAIIQSQTMTPEEKRKLLRSIDRGMVSYTSKINEVLKEMGVRPQDPSGPLKTLLRQATRGPQ